MTGRRVKEPITLGTLAPLIERHSDRWKIWPSAHGEYACATARRGLSWVRPGGCDPVGPGGAYVQTLVTDSPEELSEAITQENERIARLLTQGELRRDR